MTSHHHDAPSGFDSDFYAFGRDASGRYRFSSTDLPAKIRLIGDGEIGGKARGLVFVMRAIESGYALTKYEHLLRFPDSVVVSTQVFDDFIELNRLHKEVEAGCTGDLTLEELDEHIVSARFPEQWIPPLRQFLEAETRPLAVRSSSIMEDDPEHSFAGIYLSDFLANRGPLDDRLTRLMHLIKRVYASTFAPDARAYRKRHRLDWHKEKMAILIQNMIGSLYSHGLFYPLVGGVAFSRNYYPWSSRLRAEDGVVRLVVGTGTRAVGREYARVFSPRLPGLRPEGNDLRMIIRNSQETVDVLDMAQGVLTQTKLNSLDNPLLTRICSFATEDGTVSEPLSSAAMVSSNDRLLASFTRLIEGESLMPFTPLVRDILSRLRDLIGFDADIEFAVEFSGPEPSSEGTPLFYLLQARPLGNRPEHQRVEIPDVPTQQRVLECQDVLGNGRLRKIHHLILVEPESYRWDRAYDIARSIGRINQRLVSEDEPYILIGPGRWASSNPQLGVPVQYNEISGAVVIVEMSTQSLAPELSYGTHFYADMVASDVLYLPLDEQRGDTLNRRLLNTQAIEYRDEFVTHFVLREGLDAFVDGEARRGLIALRSPSQKA